MALFRVLWMASRSAYSPMVRLAGKCLHILPAQLPTSLLTLATTYLYIECSGKTHTMTGSGDGVMRGIIPRAVEQILKRVKSLEESHWRYELKASFLEIYNEQVSHHCLHMASKQD
jgi:hypothetical protein